MISTHSALTSDMIEDRRVEMVCRFDAVRGLTESLCKPLVTEDYVVQSMPDVSPTKWHLAHTSWFFETFLLSPHLPDYSSFDPTFAFLFNSYYVTVGDRHCRQNRGLLSRPTVAEVYRYRAHVNKQMRRFLGNLSTESFRELLPVLELGLHHEQQHQELMLTDIKHVFWVNPLRPAYRETPQIAGPAGVQPMRWIGFEAGLREIGFAGEGFSFDNESPRHRVFLEPFELGSRLVTNGEYRAFMEDGGYRRPDLWLSAGWATVNAESWRAPLYWIEQDGQWQNHSLSGLRPVDDSEPVCHVSYFEADAFARWANARLATEAEWETAATGVPVEGNFVESELFHPSGTGFQPASSAQDTGWKPVPQESKQRLEQMFGDAWEWTGSAYLGYPGYRPAAARSASTTANSCAISSYCAADRALLRERIYVQRTATFFRRMPAGNSRVFGWPAMFERLESEPRRIAQPARSAARGPHEPNR